MDTEETNFHRNSGHGLYLFKLPLSIPRSALCKSSSQTSKSPSFPARLDRIALTRATIEFVDETGFLDFLHEACVHQTCGFGGSRGRMGQ